jgi:broad specificity phosphatase PhoE
MTAPGRRYTPKDFIRRVTACTEDLIKTGRGDAVVVCHGGVIGVMMGHLFPKENRNFYAWQPPPGGGYTLRVQNGVLVGFEEL